MPDLDSDLLWTANLDSDGVGGVMATGKLVVVGGRDASDRRDRFEAFDFRSGKSLWVHEYEAEAEFDYGNSPRATPCSSDGLVVTLGATGIVSGLDAETGVALWSVDLCQRFGCDPPTWGFSGSPLVRDGVVLLQACPAASLVALDLFSGATRWTVAGAAPAYASLVPAGDNRIIGIDQEGYFIRSAEDGTLLWNASPEFSGDFGVPCPVPYDGGVIFASENNGVQQMTGTGKRLDSSPHAIDDSLIPDTHTPVVVGDRLLVAYDGLHGLDLRQGLAERWVVGGETVRGYASVIASGRRALVTTDEGEMLLVGFDDATAKVVDQKSLSESRISVLSHPAVVGNRLLVRVGRQLRVYRMSGEITVPRR